MTQHRDGSAARHAGGWIVMGGLFLVACMWFKQPQQPQPTLTPNGHLTLGIDINQASPAELACIPGVGENLARRLVEHRQTHGRFQSLNDLQQVPGVGPATAARLVDALLPFPEPAARLAAAQLPTGHVSDPK